MSSACNEQLSWWKCPFWISPVMARSQPRHDQIRQKFKCVSYLPHPSSLSSYMLLSARTWTWYFRLVSFVLFCFFLCVCKKWFYSWINNRCRKSLSSLNVSFVFWHLPLGVITANHPPPSNLFFSILFAHTRVSTLITKFTEQSTTQRCRLCL